MSKFTQLEIGQVGLVQQGKDGRITQIGLTTEQNKMLQVFLSALSAESPLIQMSKEYDLVLKSDTVTGSAGRRPNNDEI